MRNRVLGHESTGRRSSVAGLEAFGFGGAVYSGTKSAVAAISEGLRHEVGDMIRTTVIMPGAIDTELKTGTLDPASRKFVNAFINRGRKVYH